MTKSIAKPDSKKQDFDRRLKLVQGKLDDLSAHSDEKLTLLRGESVVWRSKKPKAEAKPVKKKSSGRPVKKKNRTSVDELQAMREEKAQRTRALLQNKRKSPAKKTETSEKTQSKAFSVAREDAPARRKKRA